MQRTTIVKLEVVADFIQAVESGSSTNDDPPVLMTELHLDVDKVVTKSGFKRTRPLDDDPSRRNGGWAYYDTYVLSSSDDRIKMLINVRSADHASKPDLETKNEMRLGLLNKKADEIGLIDSPNEVDKGVIDAYYKEREWGAQYYIGKGDKYSDPVDSLDKLNIMLIGQLNKMKDRYL